VKTIKIISVVFIIILLNSCNKDNSAREDYLIFGHFYGECYGEQCIEIFKLEDNRLLEDSKDKYPNNSGFYKGDYHELSNKKFELVKDLINYFPDSLLKVNETYIGQPDAGDWGGLYIEYNRNGVRHYWLLDQLESNVPDNLHEFIDEVNAKIKLISD